MLLTTMTYHYCSCIRVLSSLQVYGFTTTCFHVWLTLRMRSSVVNLVLVGSRNVSCAIVIYLSYCYGDQLIVRGVRVPAEGPTTLQWRRRWDLV